MQKKFIIIKSITEKKIIITPNNKPMSPILFTIKALRFALIADSFLYQNPIVGTRINLLVPIQ